MSFAGELSKERDQCNVSADNLQAMMQPIHKHLRVEMRRTQAVQEEGAKCGPISAPNFQEGSQVRLDARHIRTAGPTRKLDWKRLRQFGAVR